MQYLLSTRINANSTRNARASGLGALRLGLMAVLLSLVLGGCAITPGAATRNTARLTQLAYVRADLKSDLVKYENYSRHLKLQDKARKRYRHAVQVGLKGLEKRYPGFRAALSDNPTAAVAQLKASDLDLIFWTSAAWMSAISISLDKVELLGQLPQPTALLERALVLEPDYEEGTLHEVFMALDMTRDATMGGGEASARAHYARALELSKGQRASLFVGYATSIAVKKQDRAEFEASLKRALELDPKQTGENRIANTLSQRKARYLLAHVEDLFDSAVEEEPTSAE